MNKIIKNKLSINGEFEVPGDKSISHRAIMFSSISKGTSYIDGFLEGEDCLATIDCFRKLGVEIEQNKDKVKINGKGLLGLEKPKESLYVGNSGTSIRLMAGLLSGQKFSSIISGDDSIKKRPMNRVIEPLSFMNAKIKGEIKKDLAPLVIEESNLVGIEYALPVASAQIKSSILLASLYAKGQTTIIEKDKSRDHTEIMLNGFGANIITEGNKVISKPVEQLYAQDISVPGDISSAAFLIVAALILDNSCITIKNIGVNETRIGLITALKRMGGDIELINKRYSGGEAIADIKVKSSKLNAITIEGEIIPKMIDEIPIFAVAALFAKGTSVIKDAAELKVKESNRINAMTKELKKMKADINETEDGMIINGGKELCGAKLETYCDHRIAMSLAIAAIAAKGESEIIDSDIVNVSFPNFFSLLD